MLNRLLSNNGYCRFLSVIVILVTITYTINIFVIKKEKFTLKQIRDVHHTKIFDIYTKGCKIPHMDPFDKAVLPYVKNNSYSCSNLSQLVISNDTHLILNHDAFDEYSINESQYPFCYYQYFWRLEPGPKERDNIVKFGGKVVFNETAKIDDEFVRVCCHLNNKKNITDYYAFVPVHRSKSREFKENRRKLNVLIIGLDSVSRLNFHRQMPLTNDFLKKELGAIEYLGYNKVGDNTFSNLVPVLSGLNDTELVETCWHTKDDKFDNCSFLWQNYHQAGYMTSFAEEASWMGLFNYLKKGFIKQPVTHMWGVLNRQAEHEIGYKGFNSKLCLGVQLTVNYLLDYTLRFVRTYQNANQNYFGLFWESSISHDTINYDPKVDIIYTEFLKKLALTEALDDSILFFMSDHGFRWGGILNTYQGRLEERIPFFFVVTPEWFKLKYPEIQKNLETNAGKLTSHYDLYETLKAIVNEDYASEAIDPIRGMSLFRRVPFDRTCESAGIPPHWCTCHESDVLPTDDKIANLAAIYAISHINLLLVDHTYCAKVKLDKIIDATISKSVKFDDKDNQINYITVVFRTKFVGAIFEATVKCTKCETANGFELGGPISRNNLYGDEGDCIEDSKLRLYCYCKM